MPGFAGTGLFGQYTAFSFSSSPIATFLAPNVCFPDCHSGVFSDGSGGLAVFTNGNATDIVFGPGIQPPNNWSNSGLSINGYIAINQPGTYHFSLGSDDNSHLTIGGQNFLNIPGCCTTVNGAASFSAAGLYPILVQFTEFGGGSYLDLTAHADNGDGGNGACLFGCVNTNGALVDSGLFYSDAQLQGAPAPQVGSGWYSGAILTVLGLAAWVRRRHAQI